MNDDEKEFDIENVPDPEAENNLYEILDVDGQAGIGLLLLGDIDTLLLIEEINGALRGGRGLDFIVLGDPPQHIAALAE